MQLHKLQGGRKMSSSHCWFVGNGERILVVVPLCHYVPLDDFLLATNKIPEKTSLLKPVKFSRERGLTSLSP